MAARFPAETLRRRLTDAGIPKHEQETRLLLTRFPIELRESAESLDADVVAEILLHLIHAGIIRLPDADAFGFLSTEPPFRHVCHLYRSHGEVLDLSLAFLRSSLALGEAFSWVVPPFLSETRVIAAIEKAGMDAQALLRSQRLELLDHDAWYFNSGELRPIPELIEQWSQRQSRALERGYSGLAVTGDGSSCVDVLDDLLFFQYERTVHSVIDSTKMRALCTYSAALFETRVEDIPEVVASHESFILRAPRTWLAVRGESLQAAENMVRAFLEKR